jgi:hypothetical protein
MGGVLALQAQRKHTREIGPHPIQPDQTDARDRLTGDELGSEAGWQEAPHRLRIDAVVHQQAAPNPTSQQR